MKQPLSKDFSLGELTKSDTALRLGISNTPGPQYINNLRLLCENVLQPIRDHFGLPVKVNSGYRSANLNHAMGGVPTSQHLFGMAADIEIPGIHNVVLWQWIKDSGIVFDQLIAEHLEEYSPSAGWVHISYKSGSNRQEDWSCTATGIYVRGLHYAGE